MQYDFNVLEVSADNYIKSGNFKDAMAIYFFMADGDPSLDGGHLGERLAYCYRALGDIHAAKYWYGRALEENPEVYKGCSKSITELGDVSIDRLIGA